MLPNRERKNQPRNLQEIQYSPLDMEEDRRQPNSGDHGSNHHGNSVHLELGSLESSPGETSPSHPHYTRHGGRRVHPMPEQIYDRYMDTMEHSPSRKQSARRAGHEEPHPDYPELAIDLEAISTMYPKKDRDNIDPSKTMIRRRRTASKRRSSKKQRERQDLEEMMDDEENHLLPSLRLQRKSRTKTLKQRRDQMREEAQDEHDHVDGDMTFKDKYAEMKERQDLTAGNFASLLRDSTLTKVKKLTDWRQPRKWERFRRSSREFFQHFKIWVNSFKVIEGTFGSAIMSYFRFVRWLMFLNLYIMVILFFCITVPYLALQPYSFPETVDSNMSVYHWEAVNCSEEYKKYNHDFQDVESTFEKVLDFLQGTGWMERTVLFYGIYYNKTYYEWRDGDFRKTSYNMGLAYLLAIGTAFIISFLLILKNSAKTVKASFGMTKTVAAFSNSVFSGWDYCISNEKAAKVKKSNLYNEFKDNMKEVRLQWERENRTTKRSVQLFFIRLAINMFVLALLGGSLFLVYYATVQLLQLQEQELNEIVALIVQYLPYLTITILNFIIPIVFQKIVTWEEYSSTVMINITLARSILLRLASLIVLIGSLYQQLILASNEGTCGNRKWSDSQSTVRGSVKCWETYVGQQIYKLVLLDLIVESAIMVFVYFPRRLLYNRFGTTVKLIKLIGPQVFDLPQSVVDIIYSQTLCWLGMFYSPLIPFLAFLKCVIFFYLRKWTVLRNCTPADQPYRASRSASLFMYVLLFSLVMTAVPVGYMVGNIPPSKSCGPFRLYSQSEHTMFDVISLTIESWPVGAKDVFLFLGTVGFLVPLLILLILAMYYYWLMIQGYKKREKLLQTQLKLEGQDKKFLLHRVNEILLQANAAS